MPTAWTSSIPTDSKPYEYLAENPWALKLAQAHMRIHWEGRPVFFDALDFGKRFGQDTDGSTVLFVDVGGSTGSQSLALRERYPNLPGRVLLQDRPEVVEQAKSQLPSSANIEAEVYNIFTPQPIKGMINLPWSHFWRTEESRLTSALLPTAKEPELITCGRSSMHGVTRHARIF